MLFTNYLGNPVKHLSLKKHKRLIRAFKKYKIETKNVIIQIFIINKLKIHFDIWKWGKDGTVLNFKESVLINKNPLKGEKNDKNTIGF